jgi:bacteriocin-like protein
MTNQHTDGTTARPIELTEDDLEQVTGGAMVATTAIVTGVTVREDPCAGGRVTFR